MFRESGQISLFGVDAQTVIPPPKLGGANIQLVPRFLTTEEAGNLFAQLKSMPGWQQDHIRIYGKSHPLPRLHRWFTNSNQPYKWSGIQMRPEPFPTTLQYVLQRIAEKTSVWFNTALGNLYRSGKDSVSWHSDDEPDLGQDPVIASLSLGATRKFLLRRKDDHSVTASYDLTHGSLLLMSGNTQALWEHCVPKTTQNIGMRINLTFRAIRR